MTLVPAEVEKNTKSAMAANPKGVRPLLLSWKGVGLAALSGFLLTLAFPRWNLWGLAWAALIPLLYALDRARNRKEAFLLGFTAGFVFFLLSISWLRYVTLFGLFFVVTVLAFYWGIFGIIFFSVIARKAKGLTKQSMGPEIASPATVLWQARNDGGAPLFLSTAWVALEFIRSELPIWGFGWNLLGASQASNLWAAELASLGGVYCVSFLVFLGNAVIYSLIGNVGAVLRPPAGRAGVRPQWNTGQPHRVASTLLLFSLLLGSVLLFGWSRIQTFSPPSFFRVSVLQGNIPQLLKWDSAYRDEILRIYLNLTELASYDEPQLIVWPEAAYPGFFNREMDAEKVKELVRKIQIPLVIGSPHQGERAFYNSAYLLDSSGEIVQRYDKIRLVPFGEYVPWKLLFGFLESYAYALGVSDFSAGRELTVFHLGESGLRFSVLICFEDIFPELARKFVDRGADFLTVITNDAWFGRSSAPYQHLQASVFRAIENGVSVVRAANTGVSAFITPLGQVAERVRNQEGRDTFVMGGMTYPVVSAPEMTFYRQGGWLFPYGCLTALVIYVIIGIVEAGLRARPFSTGRPQKGAPTFFLVVFLMLLSTGCVRLSGGAFYAKKGPGDEAPQVKEVYVDTNQLLPGKKQAPGKIEVG